MRARRDRPREGETCAMSGRGGEDGGDGGGEGERRKTRGQENRSARTRERLQRAETSVFGRARVTNAEERARKKQRDKK